MVTSLEEAHEIIAAQAETNATLQTLTESHKAALATIQKQQHQIEQYLKRLYSHTSERYCPEQILFDPLLLQSLPDPAAAPAGEELASESPAPPPRRRAKRPRHGRLPILDHLERVVIDLDVDPDQRVCPETGKPMVVIGYEESEKLEFRPGQLFVNVYHRPKYASPAYSGRSRPLIPIHSVHPFRSNPSTDSGHSVHCFRRRPSTGMKRRWMT